MKVFFAAFLYLQFDFVIFCWKNMGTKAARKMLAKLTLGVNYINFLCAHFLYESAFFVKT